MQLDAPIGVDGQDQIPTQNSQTHSFSTHMRPKPKLKCELASENYNCDILRHSDSRYVL